MDAHFGNDLQFSWDQAGAPFWEEVYRTAFPDFGSMVDVRKDGWAQRGGIDRVITTLNGRTWTVDEKVRRQKWDDFLLEHIADEGKNTPGWIEKDLACDYIAYAFLPNRECYLLPVPALQRAWRNHKSEWLTEYRTKAAPNTYKGRKWTTISCPVPIKVVMREIAVAMFFRWKSDPLVDAPIRAQVTAPAPTYIVPQEAWSPEWDPQF
jgi:hypothetical protein